MRDTHLQLTAEQIEFFRRDGYLVVEEVFTDADLQPLIEEITAAVDAKARELVTQGKLSSTFAELPFERRLARITQETDAVALSLWNGTLSGPAIFNTIRHPRLLDVAEQFCGPEIIASSVYRIRPKVPGHYMSAVPWHQDSGYTEPFCDQFMMLTVWLPLVNATRENGCLWVVPGAHRTGKVVKHVGRTGKPYLVIPDEELRQLPGAVCVPVKKGGVLLMHNLTPHASFENVTPDVRWSMDLRYQSAKLPTNYPMTRNQDEFTASPEAGVPVACYPPEADFLVRSKTRPNEVVTDPQRFHAIRANHQSMGVTKRWEVVPV